MINKLKFILVIGLAFTGSLRAAPSLLNFQGKLLDTNKNPRNGSFNMTFRICDSPAASCASPIWTETQSGITVTNGVFTVQLGAANALAPSVFTSDARYLEIQIGSEVSSARERLVTSPYAFRASIADDVTSGDGDYIHNTNDLQAGATFYVSSGSVSGQLTVGGVIKAGSENRQITTAAGKLDATQLNGVLPNASLSGTYTNPLVLSSNTNVFTGNGAGLTNVTASDLLPGNTNYIQNRTTMQSGSGFYVAIATVGGSFTATGTVVLGGVAGTNDVTVKSNLTVGGNVRVNGNALQDSLGTSRLTLGSNVVLNANLGANAGYHGVSISSAIVFVNATNGDNYIAYPMTAGADITAKQVLYIAGANDIRPVVANNPTTVVGVAANSVASGGVVYVITSGIVTNVVAAATFAAGVRICADGTPDVGRAISCTTDGAVIGKSLTGAGGVGSTFTLILTNGN